VYLVLTQKPNNTAVIVGSVIGGLAGVAILSIFVYIGVKKLRKSNSLNDANNDEKKSLLLKS